MDEFMKAAYEEAIKGLEEGGIPIGSVIVHKGKIIGAGHNRRVQKGSAILHGEMDALENAYYTLLFLLVLCVPVLLCYTVFRKWLSEKTRRLWEMKNY